MRCCSKATIPPKHQADAVLIQANPISGIKYTVLDTTKNVRIIGICAYITWATTQPTPLKVHLTIDGQNIIFTKVDPVSAAPYQAVHGIHITVGNQVLIDNTIEPTRSILLEGRSVKVEAEITWGTTQPTPLVCRVKYAKW